MIRDLPDGELWGVAREVLGRGGVFGFRARGHSMSPAILDGERVVIGPLSEDGPAPGDVVFVRTAEGLRLHRVITSRPLLVVRGDAEGGPGEPVVAADVAGRVVAVRRSLLRRLIHRLTRPLRRIRL